MSSHSFSVGRTVNLQNLSKTEYNGKRGVVQSTLDPSTQRYNVWIVDFDRNIKIKPINMVDAQACTTDASSMSVKELKGELKLYDIATGSFLDKESMAEAVAKARVDGRTKKEIERNISEEELFEQPTKQDCDICCLPLPPLNQTKYQICCGKMLCMGCIYGELTVRRQSSLCPFCRAPMATSFTEGLGQLRKRMDAGDAEAFVNIGAAYRDGQGVRVDLKKAFALFQRGEELGSKAASYNLSIAYDDGEGVDRDHAKAIYHCRLAAIGVRGSSTARYNLGVEDLNSGSKQSAMKHFIIAASAGDTNSLHNVTNGHRLGLISKDDYEKTVRAYQADLLACRSGARDKAAANMTEKKGDIPNLNVP